MLGVALALLTLEAGSALALGVLQGRGLRFEPLHTSALTDAQRDGVRRLIAGENRYLEVSEALGWTLRPGGASGLYHASASGRREPEPGPLGPGERRVLAFGDSYTHGDEVADGESWPAVLSERPDVAVSNFGVPGYGPDQAYLRWEAEGAGEGPATVVIALLSVDLPRTLTRFHPYLNPEGALPMGKPRFTLDSGGLTLLPNPLPSLHAYSDLLADEAGGLARLGEGDELFASRPHEGPLDALALGRLARLAWWSAGDERARLDALAVEITLAIVTRWRAEAQERGQDLLVVGLPGPEDGSRAQAGEAPSLGALLERLAARGVPTMEVEAAVRSVPEDRRFQPGGHYTAEVNRAVAAAIDEGLKKTTGGAP